MSTKGQVVIPAEVRREAGFAPGDVLLVEAREPGGPVVITRRESLEEVSARVSKRIPPGVPPLLDASALYETRGARL
jgi:AbrB family looped-hinge helix DNA binding protein